MRNLLFSVACMTLSTAALFSQSYEADLVQSMFKMEKRMVVSEFLELNEMQEKAFWPVYDAYEADRTKISGDRLKILQQYADEYGTLTDDQADELLGKALLLQKDNLSLFKKYYKKAKKAVGPKTAVSWIQVEDYIYTALRMEILDNIPFVGE